MINRLIFIIESLFDERKYHRLGIEVFQKNGFQVEVWDLTSILHPDYIHKMEDFNIVVYEGCRKFSNRDQMYQQLSSLSCHDFVISFISYVYWNLGIYRALSKSKAQYAGFFANAVPIHRVNRIEMLKTRLGDLITFKKPASKFQILWMKFFMRLPCQWLGVKPARLMLIGGNKSLCSHYPIDRRKTEMLKVHSFDYNDYLADKDQECLSTEPVAVFIDEFIPFSRDLYFEGREMTIGVEEYRSLLNRFFSEVEKKTGLEVVVAADPRSDYEALSNCFNGRKIVKGLTRKLIKQSRLVMAHRSTAVSFANLYHKPAIFLTCSKLAGSLDGKQIDEMAKWFGKHPVCMENAYSVDWTKELSISSNHYDRYRHSYIKSYGSEDIPLWQIVANRLMKEGSKEGLSTASELHYV